MSKTDLFDDLYFDYMDDLYLEALSYINRILKSNRDEFYINNYEVANNGTYIDWYKVN